MLYAAPDGKLYKKYGLNREEIDFIESMIRPMDLSQNGGAND
jgi:site-specific DNA-methyltransferase (adenine-specific)